MKKSRIITVGALAGALLAVASAVATAADATVAADVYSAYVWRGVTFNDGAVFQPSVDVSGGGFGVNVWANMDIDDYGGAVESGEFSEVDLTLSYGFAAGPLDMAVGYIEYLFPGSEAEGTREVYIEAGMELVPGLSASCTLYYDFDEVEDYYVSAGLAYGMDLSDTLSVELGGSVGYAGEDMSAGDDAGLHDYNLSIAATLAPCESVAVTASLAYTDGFDDDVLPEQDTDVYGGVSVAYSF